MITRIIVSLQFEALHCWPSCPYDDVAFLRSPHRHLFHVVAKKAVKHDDRDIEIIRFKREIQRYLAGRIDPSGNLGALSCEMLAKELLTTFACDFVSVLEDNENGAEVLIEGGLCG